LRPVFLLAARKIKFENCLQSGTDVERKLNELRLLGHSQDDLDRIERVARSTVDPGSTPVGKKATATLMEIERNRQLLLVQQGTQVWTSWRVVEFDLTGYFDGRQVLESERKRVAELKRRVQDQVRQQWEERRQQERDVNCHSLNSVGSDESRSSLTGSDAPTER
jgi:hypothetical protein